MFNFEKLEVWHKAIAPGDTVCSETSRFPVEERFGLTNQMRRSVVSVSSNIAEGSSRSSAVDYARFIEIGTGSVFELVSQSFIARRQHFLPQEAFELIYNNPAEVGRMLSGLRTSLEQR